MNYILNTKTKKVEIYWDDNNEYQAIINFLSQCVLTEEKSPYIIKANELSPNTITWNTNNLLNNIAFTGNALEGVTGITTILDSTAETTLSSGLVDATLADINLTTITADKITAALETEPKE